MGGEGDVRCGKGLNQWAREIDECGERQGWNERFELGDTIATIQTKMSEALEEMEENQDPTDVYYPDDGNPEGFGVKLADVIIRVLHICARYAIDIEALMELKMEYNRTRR